MMKIKIAETAQKHGLKSAYALQKALNISPTMASRLWKGEFDKIGINTLEKLCDYFYCQPNDFLEYPLTLSGNTQTSKDVGRATQLSNTQTSNVKASSGRLVESDNVASDNETLLSTADVAQRLGINERTVRDNYNNGKLAFVKRGTKNLVKESDFIAFRDSRNSA